MRRVLGLVALFYAGLLPFIPVRESFYEIIMPSILLKSVAEDAVFLTSTLAHTEIQVSSWRGVVVASLGASA